MATRKKPSKFDRLAGKLRRRGARNPDALAAWIGDRKYGAKKMAKKSAAARKANTRRRKGKRS